MAFSRSPQDLAYIAGFFDGEGTVSIRHKAGEHSRRAGTGHRYHIVLVSLANTNEAVVRDLAACFGGSVRTHIPSAANHKRLWCWQLEAVRAAEFLRLIRPFLRLKAMQADLATGVQATMVRGRVALPPDILEFREQSRQKVMALNQRGTIQ